MRWTCPFALSVASLFLGNGLVAALDPPQRSAATIAWENDFDAALQRAQKEHKPLFVAFIMDNEPANDEIVYRTYLDPEVVKLSGQFVCLACCTGEHKDEDGNCIKFPGITCAQHQAIDRKARAKWTTGEDVPAPQHVLCDPNGRVILRKVYLISRQTLCKCMAIALSSMGSESDAKSLVDEERQHVAKWLEDAGSRNMEVREAALQELAVADDPRAMPAVMKVAKSGNDETTRYGAIAALAKKGNLLAVKPLCGMLGDSKAQIVIRVARSLETIQLPDSTPDLLVACKKEKRDRVRGFLLRAAARSSPSDAGVRDACLRALRGASTQLEGCVLIALGRMKGNSKIVETLRGLMTDRNQNTRGLVAWALGNQKCDDAVQALEKLLAAEKTPEVQDIAHKALSWCKGEKVDGYDDLYSTFFSDEDY